MTLLDAKRLCGQNAFPAHIEPGNVHLIDVLSCLSKEALRKAKDKSMYTVHALHDLIESLGALVDLSREEGVFDRCHLRELRPLVTSTGRKKSVGMHAKLEIVQAALTLAGTDAPRFVAAGKLWSSKKQGPAPTEPVPPLEAENPNGNIQAQRPKKIQKADRVLDDFDWTIMHSYRTTAQIEFEAAGASTIGVTHDGVKLDGKETVPANFYHPGILKAAWAWPQVHEGVTPKHSSEGSLPFQYWSCARHNLPNPL